MKQEERRVTFNSKERRMLKELISKYKLSETELATKFQVDQRTIQRWLNGDSVPFYTTRKYISQIYNGYKARGQNENRN